MTFPISSATLEIAALFGAEALASTLSRTAWPFRREICIDLAPQYGGSADRLADVVDDVIESWREATP